MIIVEEKIKDIYGVYQYITLFKSENYFTAEKFFEKYETKNTIELWNSLQETLLATKQPEIITIIRR